MIVWGRSVFSIVMDKIILAIGLALRHKPRLLLRYNTIDVHVDVKISMQLSDCKICMQLSEGKEINECNLDIPFAIVIFEWNKSHILMTEFCLPLFFG